MYYFVSKKKGKAELGTEANPFSTISQAASVAMPGDTIWIGEGIYREWVRPPRGGSDEEHRIVYRNIPGENPIISGSELLENWTLEEEGIWKAVIPAEKLKEYNPYADPIFGDWYLDYDPVHHTGEIFMDGAALYEVPEYEQLKRKDRPERKYRWFASVKEEYTEVWVSLPDQNPNEHVMEASVRPLGFYPEKERLNFITVSGLTVENVATQWAPPTAFQPGAIGTHWSKGWIIENCTVRNSKCSGISIGKRHDKYDNIWSLDPYKGGAQTYTEIIFTNQKKDWSKENIGSHIIRNNQIYDCGQTGIVGCMGGVFSEISGNHIYNINIRKEFGGAEMAGIKLHAPIDVVLKGNLFHDCVRGVWLDWEAQGTRVTGNTFFRNVDEDLLIEVCHGPCTVDHNFFLSRDCLLNVSQGTAFVQNLFAGYIKTVTETGRFTMYHLPHDTAVLGSMIIYGGDDKVLSNIFVGDAAHYTQAELTRSAEGGTANKRKGTVGYNGYPDSYRPDTSTTDSQLAFAKNALSVFIKDNVYFNHAEKYEHETGALEVKDFEVTMNIVEEDGAYYLETNLYDYPLAENLDLITTEILGKAFQPEAAYENADGTPFVLDTDYAGVCRREKTMAGPMAGSASRILLWSPKENGQ